MRSAKTVFLPSQKSCLIFEIRLLIESISFISITVLVKISYFILFYFSVSCKIFYLLGKKIFCHVNFCSYFCSQIKVQKSNLLTTKISCKSKHKIPTGQIKNQLKINIYAVVVINQ